MGWFIVAGALMLIAFLYIVSTPRENKIVNAIMVVIGILLPTGVLAYVFVNVPDYQQFGIAVLTILVNVPWWGYVIAIIVDLFCLVYLIFVSGEQLERVFDTNGNAIGWRGGSMGLAFLSMALCFALFVALFAIL
ncbi:MAG: hypothetical protein IJY57_01710 [Clostridia bacterium]|nr:hypothetical protein [Clostridia bacterium]